MAGVAGFEPANAGVMVPETGIEPATKCLESLRSANELLGQVPCLTAWLHSNIAEGNYKLLSFSFTIIIIIHFSKEIKFFLLLFLLFSFLLGKEQILDGTHCDMFHHTTLLLH